MNSSALGSDASVSPRRIQWTIANLRVIIVEDSAIIRARLAESLAEIPNLEIVGQADTEAEALALLRQGAVGRGGARSAAEAGHGPWRAEGLRDEGAAGEHQDHRLHQLRVSAVSRPQPLLGADYFFDKAREFHRVRDVLLEACERKPAGVSLTVEGNWGRRTVARPVNPVRKEAT